MTTSKRSFGFSSYASRCAPRSRGPSYCTNNPTEVDLGIRGHSPRSSQSGIPSTRPGNSEIGVVCRADELDAAATGLTGLSARPYLHREPASEVLDGV